MELPPKRPDMVSSDPTEMNASDIGTTNASGRFPAHPELRFLTICLSIQLLANLLILPFIWGEGEGGRRRKLRKIAPDVLEQYSELQASFELPVGTVSIPYRFMPPLKQKQERKYPLVLFLHGAGSRGTDNTQQLGALPSQLAKPPWREKYACYVLAPQCPREKWWGQSEMVEVLVALLKRTLNEHPLIDSDRIYLIGLSMGGNGCWALSASHPDFFAGVAPFCGQGDPSTAPALVNIPVWVVHGDADQVIDVSWSRNMVEALEKENGNVIYHELKGVGHNCWQDDFSEPSQMMEWMFQQMKRSIH